MEVTFTFAVKDTCTLRVTGSHPAGCESVSSCSAGRLHAIAHYHAFLLGRDDFLDESRMQPTNHLLLNPHAAGAPDRGATLAWFYHFFSARALLLDEATLHLHARHPTLLPNLLPRLAEAIRRDNAKKVYGKSVEELRLGDLHEICCAVAPDVVSKEQRAHGPRLA
jgi:hypothetical protein